jgi:hypothetical protein
MKQKLALFALLIMLAAHAVNMVAVNSFDGRDVLSGVYYANVLGVPAKFMPSQGASADIFCAKAGSGNDILLIQSSTIPVSGFVESCLRANNNTVTVYLTTDGAETNLDLAEKSGAQSFIVVDSAYSDSAISVLAYAKLTNSYVLLSNKDNAQQIKGIVAGKKVVIFGLVDQEVTDALASENPQIIGKGEDKYEDNVVIAGKTLEEFSVNRLIMTDGSALEESMAEGDQPVLLSGRLVPQPTYDFIKEKVRSGKLAQIMLIGNDLVQPVYDMRERMKAEFEAEGQNKTVGIVVKFAQVVPSEGASVLNLDMFVMPAYVPQLNITEIAFNTQSKKIMATVNNTGDGAAYFSMELRVKVDGQEYRAFPASEPVLVQRGAQKGMEYSFDASGIKEGNITAVALVKYGASKGSLDSYISKEGPLESISYVDKSNVSVQAASYNAEKKVLSVTLRNLGEQKAYAFSKVTLNMGGAPATITSSGTKELEPAALMVEEFPLELSEADLAANSEVTIGVEYGGRPGFLVKKEEFTMPLAKESAPLPMPLLGIIGAAVIVILVAAYLLAGRKGGEKPAEAPPAPKEPQKPAAAAPPRKPRARKTAPPPSP